MEEILSCEWSRKTGKQCDFYKDFCSCGSLSSALAEYREKQRIRNVNGTINFLKKNKIVFNETKLPNVVEIPKKDVSIILSLKKDKKTKCFKYRMKGCKDWNLLDKDSFLKKIKSLE
jgi:hypothetical protein